MQKKLYNPTNKINKIIENIKTGNTTNNIAMFNESPLGIFFSEEGWVSCDIFKTAIKFPKECPNLPYFICSQLKKLEDFHMILSYAQGYLDSSRSTRILFSDTPTINSFDEYIFLSSFLEKNKNYSPSFIETDTSYRKYINSIIKESIHDLFRLKKEKHINAYLRVFTVLSNFQIRELNKFRSIKYLLGDNRLGWYWNLGYFKRYFISHQGRLDSIKENADIKKSSLLIRLDAGVLASLLQIKFLENTTFHLFSNTIEQLQGIIKSLIIKAKRVNMFTLKNQELDSALRAIIDTIDILRENTSKVSSKNPIVKVG